MTGADHDLRKPIERVASNSGLKPEAARKIAEDILRELDTAGLIHYAPEDTLALLSSVGRVLCLVAEFPDATIREIGTRLGTSDGIVSKQITRLAQAGLIQRTRVLGRNQYKVDWKTLGAHPDVVHFSRAFRLKASASTPE